MAHASAVYRLLTPPPTGSAAIAIIELSAATAPDLEAALARLTPRPVPVGAAPLRDLAGIDQAIVARPAPTLAYVTPHAGSAVVRALISVLERSGVAHAPASPPTYPEAAGDIEQLVLQTLPRAASPLAIDLLLDQPRRWAAAAPGSTTDPALLARSAILNRLITPPTVVALGRPNIGKSSLLNALAKRDVAIVADLPGTTRDHVGVLLNLAGLVVRYIDAPGLDDAPPSPLSPPSATPADPMLADAQSLARTAAAAADLLLLCSDPTTPPLPPPNTATPTLRLTLRADLAPDPAHLDPATLPVSARTGLNLDTLVATIRERLVPAKAIADPGPWRFW